LDRGLGFAVLPEPSLDFAFAKVFTDRMDPADVLLSTDRGHTEVVDSLLFGSRKQVDARPAQGAVDDAATCGRF
jgi:hypothetical protein